MKVLIALCLGVLAVQALPKLQDPIDDLVRELEELNQIATTEQTHAIDQIGGELRSLDELNQELLKNLGDDLQRDSGILEDQVHELERQAREYRVDISECIGDQLEQITKLPEHILGRAGECINMGHAQAQQAVDEGYIRIDQAIGPIDEYWREVQRCREADRQEQEICLAELNTEVINDKIQIPAKIHLVVQEVIGHLEAEKPTLLLCIAGRVEELNEEGGRIVQGITECADRLFPGPRQSTNLKALSQSQKLQDPIDDLVRELEELNQIATTEQTRAIDQIGGELRSLDEINSELLQNLGEDLQRDSEILEDQVHELERQAREYRVDISECIGDQLEQITKLPEHILGRAGECINMGHAQAQQAVDEGYIRIDQAIGPIDEYWREVQRCREADRQEQEICLAELNTEVINDKIQIPAKIHLVVQEVIGHLEAEKPTLLLCIAGRVEELNEEGGRIVQGITECADRLFPGPRQSTNLKALSQSQKLQDPIDDLVRELEELNQIATTEQTRAIDQIGGELRSLDEINSELLQNLGEDLQRDSEILEDQVHELERQAREYRVDISECIGDQLEQITKLPEHILGRAGECINMGHAQAQQAVDEGYIRIDQAIGPIDEYWREVQRCREADRQEQEICLAELNTEVINDKIQIPAKIHLVVQEVIGHLEAEKPSLLLCIAGRVEELNEEGGRIVQGITECADRLFPGPRSLMH